MRIQTGRFLAGLVMACMLLQGCSHCGRRDDATYQTSTITALLNGAYDGETSFGELGRHGDFGIGTLDALDGEMIGVDGIFYQAKTDGKVYVIKGSARTPFAVVKFFSPDRSIVLDRAMDCRGLESYLDSVLTPKNIFYALRIEGWFSSVRVRSVPAQEKPYPRLAEAAKKQAVFELPEIEGTIVGFRSPEDASGITVPGYHFHFLSADRKTGGHLLSCNLKKATIAIDASREFFMVIPHGDDYGGEESSGNRMEELRKIEK